jgi:DNA-binding CsgD family transcriptional regulator
MGWKADLPKLTDLVYEAAVDFQAWEPAITGIADAMQAHETKFEIYDPGSPSFVLAPRSDPDYLRVYLERWASSNFMRERGLTLQAGAIYRFETFMTRQEFERTALYNEFWRPQGIDNALIINATKDGPAGSGLGFSRPKKHGPFEREDEALLRALVPHLRRAAALNLRLARIEMQRNGSAEMLNRCADAAFLVDRQAHILFANAAAENMLGQNAGLRLDKGGLAAATHAKTMALRRLIAGGGNAAEGDVVVLPSADGASLTALVLPLRAETQWLTQHPAAIVFVKDPKRSLPSREHLAFLFDLTRAQAGVAREVLEGDGIQAVAARLGISPATARTHLLEIFHKTGTSRQAELVRVILQRSFNVRD